MLKKNGYIALSAFSKKKSELRIYELIWLTLSALAARGWWECLISISFVRILKKYVENQYRGSKLYRSQEINLFLTLFQENEFWKLWPILSILVTRRRLECLILDRFSTFEALQGSREKCISGVIFGLWAKIKITHTHTHTYEINNEN